jgi:hypothetical protein
VLGCLHGNPVAVQIKADLIVALWNEKRLKRCWYRKVDAAEQFLEFPIELQRTFGADRAINVGRHDFV